MVKSKEFVSSKKNELLPYWIRLVIIFFLGWVAIYVGRSVLSPVMPHMQAEFGLSKSDLGMVSSLFFLAYTLLQVPAGIFGDKYGRRKILIPGFMLFAAFIAAVSIAPGFLIFTIFWMLTGASQGAYYGPQYALSSEAIPKHWITLGSAIIGSGMSFGIALGYYLSSFLLDSFHTSWKTPFLVIAMPVFLIALAMLFFVREHATPAEANARIKQGAEKSEVAAGEEFHFFDLFRNRNLVMAYITIFCSTYVLLLISYIITYNKSVAWILSTLQVSPLSCLGYPLRGRFCVVMSQIK